MGLWSCRHKLPNNPLHLPAGVKCGVESEGIFARRR